MSEHIQPTPTVADSLRESAGSHAEAAHPKTPGVAHERESFDFRLIVWVGVGLVATAVVIHVVVWFAFGGIQRFDAVPAGRNSELALEEAGKPLAQRLDDVPAPHLEGIERESSSIDVRTEQGHEKRFYAASDIHVRIGENEKARLFELREGQRVTLCYYEPGGEGGGLGVVTSVTSPRKKAEKEPSRTDLPDASRTLDCVILKIEPRSIAAAREWAEVQMKHSGWIDRDQEIVHVPIDRAMEEVLRSKEFRAPANGRRQPAGGRTSRLTPAVRPEAEGGKR